MNEQNEREVLDVIDERDSAEDYADRLAAALAPAEVIGEHSSGNNPWANALAWAERNPRPSAATQTAEQARPETAHSLDEFGFLNPQPAESKSSVKLTPENVAAEIEGMRLIPSAGERPWAEVLAGPHPPEVSRVAGALLTITTSTTQRYMIAYRLYENGLLAGSPVTETTKQPTVEDAAATLRAFHGGLYKPNESEWDYGYRCAYERITDWLETEFPGIWEKKLAPQQSSGDISETEKR